MEACTLRPDAARPGRLSPALLRHVRWQPACPSAPKNSGSRRQRWPWGSAKASPALMTRGAPSHAQMHLRPLPFSECRKRQVIIGWFHLDADAVPSQPRRGRAACSGPHERVQNRIAHKGKHAYQSFGELMRKGGWMFSGGRASQCPDLLEALAVQAFRNDRHDSGGEGRAAIAARASVGKE